MASIGISDVVTASVYSEKTRMKKLMKIIIIITRKWFPLQGELASLTKNVTSYGKTDHFAHNMIFK